MDLGLKGLKAVLAGASKGIGRATAEVLAAEGCDVAICARGQEAVDATVAALKAKGVKAFGESVDMADNTAYRAWVARAAEQLGGCDIFISFASAGGGPASEDSWKAVFNLDLLATFRGVEAAMPYLEKSKCGSIVAVASTAALEDFFGPQAYNAMKAAVINYASALSQQLAPKGIRVNTVSPGPVYIDGGSWDMIKTHMTPLYEQTLKAVPMGRLGDGGEVARAIAFVASPTTPFMTGTNLVIDGGVTKRVQY
ncbi:SDR family NAD(P)-dependent oxidoreductase [Phenylobacterium montanum]|uniref:D-xylose 1-dehydrogenase n=1 Tax=Phenylobacterium montanum TaxID=2823693 RepID=A0A975IYJ7_9CAUL|nr:SDR family NAD(P)-dependent oxidoreductase [Caulobacter sp. S6]QUD90526.1 SDR family oxidoreductase [Caulobacter sp. S6]